MAKTDPQLNFRCPTELKQLLEMRAVENNRSVNAEIVHRLQETFRSKPSLKNISTDSDTLKEALKEAMRELQLIEADIQATDKSQ